MRIKKALALLLALSAIGAFTACGSDADSKADSSSAAESSVEESSEEESSEEESSEEESSEEESSEAESSAEESSEASTPAEPADLGPVDANAITFDSDSLYTAEAVMDAGAAPIELTIEEVNGDKKLKVHVLKAEGKEDDDYEVPKIKFDLAALLGAENVGKIGHLSADFYCNALETWKNDDGSESLVVGNFLGAFGGNIAAAKAYDKDGNVIQNTWANHYEWALDDWENPTNQWRVETDIPALLPANGYASLDGEYYDENGNKLDAADVCADQNLFIMRWGQANSVDFYIDNLTFYDKDGNSIPIVFAE
ncbi:MAG: hypothetical protein IJ060_11575 [Oscillospiraceae bacterium]|nr:hypothetical protein [Oscillospiraceae bacterium]